MRQLLSIFISFFVIANTVIAGEGLVKVSSPYNVKTTADKLETVLKAKGMTIFARIDHAMGAQKVGETLRPTELIIFGNPKVGTALMLCDQDTGIDLPLKALITEDEAGLIWLSYNHPQSLAKRYALKGCDAVLKKIEAALGNFAKAATQ